MMLYNLIEYEIYGLMEQGQGLIYIIYIWVSKIIKQVTLIKPFIILFIISI